MQFLLYITHFHQKSALFNYVEESETALKEKEKKN